MDLNQPLNTVLGVQVPREYRYKSGFNRRFLLDKKGDIPFAFYDGSNCIGRSAYDDSYQDHVPSIRNFLDYLYEHQPIGFKDFEKDHIWTYIDVAFDFEEIVNVYLQSINSSNKKSV